MGANGSADRIRERFESRGRKLVLLIGHDSVTRRELSAEMIRRGLAVVICNGPPGCSLAHDDRCVLADMADATAILPSHPGHPRTAAYVTECARAARRPVFAHKPSFPPPPGSVIADTADAQGLAAAIEQALEGTA